MAEIRSDVAAEHAPERLIEFLRAGRPSPKPDAQVPTRIEDILERANRMRRLHQWHALAEDSTRMSAVIGEDDQQRTIDTLRDEVERLKQAITHRERANAAAAAAARDPQQSPVVKASRRRSVSRRRALQRAATGSLRAVCVTSGLVTILAGGLAVTGYVVPAVLALAAAVVTSVMGSLVVAVRLERRL